MVRKLRRGVKLFVYGVKENAIIRMLKKREIKKFKDIRRVKIYEKVKLTKKQAEEIDSFYEENYGTKIPHIWHRHFSAYTGNFDVNYFPELLYIPEFEYYMNMNAEYAKVFSDKSLLPLLAEAVGVRMPKTYISSDAGVLKNNEHRFITENQAKEILFNIGEAFAKPTVDSCSGNGCMVLNIKDGIDLCSGKPLEDILNILGENFAIQEKLKCHSTIERIYDKSVNTFRIITYRWENTIRKMPAIMRIGQGGSYLDNAHAGGMFIAIDEDGTLHKKAFTEFKEEFDKHPDTELVFDGYQIPLFVNVLDSAVKMHEALSQVGVVNWDFTIDNNGEPVLIEANMNGGSIWLAEMAHGVGCFGDNTAKVLQWLKIMRDASIEKRKQCNFGKIPK